MTTYGPQPRQPIGARQIASLCGWTAIAVVGLLAVGRGLAVVPAAVELPAVAAAALLAGVGWILAARETLTEASR